MYCLLLGAAARQFIALAWCLGVMKARQEGDAGGGKDENCEYSSQQRTKCSLGESC